MIPLQQVIAKQEKLVIGLISGTSLDGVDAALVKVRNAGADTALEVLAFTSFPYPDGLKEKLLEISVPGGGSVDVICRLNFLLGEVFAEAALAVIDLASRRPADIDLIGSHGQTVHHLPEETELYGYRIKSTLQLGEPAVIARRTGITTVADFRPADMALGGQGAPLVPYFDFIAFRSTEKSRLLLNLGGIANFTVLPKDCSLDQVLAFDTGPANMVIDGLMQQLFHLPYDADGNVARSGKSSEELLDSALRHPYFALTPPKSTGREEFGDAFCTRLIDEGQALGLAPADLMATATDLTARTVWECYRTHILPMTPADEVIVSGGGARNGVLVDSLRAKFGSISVEIIDKYGIASDAKEAVCFAVLANETVSGIPSNVPRTTGAKGPAVLGKICLP